jgi:hypothetical protein
MKFYWRFIIVIGLCITGLNAQTYTISGYVVDQESRETIIGVNIIIKGELKGTASDRNGFFRITDLDSGSYILELHHINYEVKTIEIVIRDRSLVLDDIPLKEMPIEMEEVVVTAPSSEIADIEVESGFREITPTEIKTIPKNRDDIFRAIKYLPGITGVDPISPLYSVRGSDPGENLILLDGVTIYNPYHFVTASGLFNLYAVKNVEMMVGGFSAEYGGRNSSVLYITTREGNSRKLHGELEPSLDHTNAVFDFPVGKNATMMVSGRYHYDLISRYLLYAPSYFYDMNISFNWKISWLNRLSLRYFFSKDYFNFISSNYFSYLATTFDTDIFDDYDLRYRNKWHNQALSAVLKTILSPKLYLKTQLSGSFFSANNSSLLDFEYFDKEEEKTTKLFYRTDIRNDIRDIGLKSSLSFKWNELNTLALGGEFNRYYFSNDILINFFSEGKSTREPDLLAGFMEDKITLGPLIFRGGIRFSKFSFINRWYTEPRLNAVLKLPYHLRIKGAWGNYFQYIMSINSQEYELSQFLDYYYPLKSREPSASTHYILGVEKSLGNNSQVSLDFYYKDIDRTYNFDYNISESEVYGFSEKLRVGQGTSYGLEFLWKGTWEKFSGWVSYGISKATRSYPHIMEGKELLFDYDRTHSFKAVINHQIHPKLSYSSSLQIMTGAPKTVEIAGKSYYYYDPLTGTYATYPTYDTPSKNNARLPLYVRLDLGLRKQIRKGFGADLSNFLGAKESYLNFTFGNILFLFHRNVWFYFPIGKEKLYAMGTNYFPEISVGYTIKF